MGKLRQIGWNSQRLLYCAAFHELISSWRISLSTFRDLTDKWMLWKTHFHINKLKVTSDAYMLVYFTPAGNRVCYECVYCCSTSQNFLRWTCWRNWKRLDGPRCLSTIFLCALFCFLVCSCFCELVIFSDWLIIRSRLPRLCRFLSDRLLWWRAILYN